MKKYPLAQVTALDPKPRGNKRKIKWIKGTFPDKINIEQFDLIVGMHPDEATWPIVKVCCEHKINFAIVPCCILHKPSFFTGNMQQWCDFLNKYTNNHMHRSHYGVLSIRGANRVIIGFC